MKASASVAPRLAAFLCISLSFLVSAAQAEQYLVTTSHVPDVVASGLAPIVGHLAGTQRLSLAISLPLRNQAELDDFLQRLYDPQSASYHQYLSVQEFAQRFAPTEADFEGLRKFADANGLNIVDAPANRMVLDVEAPAASIEAAFHVTLNLYQHPTEGRTFYAPDSEPTVNLDVPLLHVSGLDNFSLLQPKNISSAPPSAKSTGSGPGGSFLGSDLRAAYYGSGPRMAPANPSESSPALGMRSAISISTSRTPIKSSLFPFVACRSTERSLPAHLPPVAM